MQEMRTAGTRYIEAMLVHRGTNAVADMFSTRGIWAPLRCGGRRKSSRRWAGDEVREREGRARAPLVTKHHCSSKWQLLDPGNLPVVGVEQARRLFRVTKGHSEQPEGQ
jgi:hypothetical protein